MGHVSISGDGIGYNYALRLQGVETEVLLQALMLAHSTVYSVGEGGVEVPQADVRDTLSMHNVLSRVMSCITGKTAEQLFAEEDAKFAVKENLVQWWVNGDHPNDGVNGNVEGKVVRYYRNPEASGQDAHVTCGHIWHNHGWIDSGGDGQTVCPGDWIEADLTPENLKG